MLLPSNLKGLDRCSHATLPWLPQYQEACRAIARQHGCSQQPSSELQSPFTVIVPPKLINAMLESGDDVSSCSGEGGLDGRAEPTSSGSEQARGCAAAAADNAAAAAAQPAGTTDGSSSGVGMLLAELRGTAPIWQQLPMLEGFAADRGTAKALAKALAEQLRELGPSLTV